MSPAKCCILCVLHSSRKRTSLFLKSCIQILDLYRQFLQNQHHKKKCFFLKRNKKIKKSSRFLKKKWCPPPQIKTSKLPFSILFLCFLPVVLFFVFFVTTPFCSIESTAGGHPREGGIPREGASEGGGHFTSMGMGRRLGLEFPRCWDLFDSKSNLSSLCKMNEFQWIG